MLLTQETSGTQADRPVKENGPDVAMQTTGVFVIREVPVALAGAEAVRSPNEATLHYPTLRVEGIESLLPEQIEIDVKKIAAGGQIRIDQVQLPPCCEVIGVWFANPIVTIGPAH